MIEHGDFLPPSVRMAFAGRSSSAASSSPSTGEELKILVCLYMAGTVNRRCRREIAPSGNELEFDES